MTLSEIYERAREMQRSLAEGETPGGLEATRGYSAFNGMCLAMFGTVVGAPLRSYTTIPTVNGGRYAQDITTPESPEDGWRIAVTGTRTVTAASGSTIEGAASVTTTEATRWFYRADLADWVKEEALEAEDEPLFPDEFHEGLAALLALRLPQYGAQPSAETLALAEEADRRLRQRYGWRGSVEFDPGLRAVRSDNWMDFQ